MTEWCSEMWWKSVPTEEHKQAQVAFDFILLFYKELICCNRWYQVSLRLLRLHQLVSVRPLQKTEKCNLFDLTTYFFFLVHKLTRSYQNQTTFLTNRPVSAVIGFSKLYCSRSYIRNRLSQQKGGWYHIFCQYCYRWCVLLSSLATKPHVVHTRSYREDEHMLTAKSPWTCDWPPCQEQCTSHIPCELWSALSKCWLWAVWMRWGHRKGMAHRQSFPSARPDPARSLSYPGTGHLSLYPPLPTFQVQPMESTARRACRHRAAGSGLLLFPILFQAQLQPLSLVLRLWKELFETKFLNNALWADVIPNLLANTALSLCRFKLTPPQDLFTLLTQN